MTRMPAVLLTGEREIALVDRPLPPRRPDQVVVEVDLCGICGSDLHAPSFPQVYLGDVTMGHEASGTIRWVGERVTSWTVGQRVAINPNGNIDGTCAQCRAGRMNYCPQATRETAVGLQSDGSLAPEVAVFPGTLRALPDGMSRTAAAWVEPTANALRAVRMAGALAEKTVLVTGGGPIGQLVLRTAAIGGAGQLVLVEPSPSRRAHGSASGADVVLSPDEAGEFLHDEQIDVVIESSGNASASASALTALTLGGTFVVVGAGSGNGLDAETILLNEIVVRGSFTYIDEFEAAIDLLADGSVPVDDLAAEVVPIRDALRGFDLLRSAAAMKVFIDPRD